MSKPESVLIIDPAQELKFRGEFTTDEKKVFAKKKSRIPIGLREIFSFAKKTTIMESNVDCNLLDSQSNFRLTFSTGNRVL